ncbi:MAG: patatin-like phospholipase family protein, partial [Saprospiraceae bacterium]|nr:patatin-like phospholipase family protein [Saprospiraceae bacterium]
YYTNKDILSFLKIPKEEAEKLLSPLTSGRKATQIESLKKGISRWRVDTYLSESLRPRLVRPVGHYDPKLLLKVFRQNHVNALIVQILGLLTLIGLGLLIDNPYFRIPAGTSIFILAAVVAAVSGATLYWFGRWTLLVLVLFLLTINFLSTFPMFNHQNKAYGLDYNGERPIYDYNTINQQLHPDTLAKDKATTIQRLNNWRLRFPSDEPPKMVVYCVSGGGMKAMVWVMKVIQECDYITDEALLPKSVLITGASGGMIGASYLRELYLQREFGDQRQPIDEVHIDKLSKDLLNSMAFTIVSNDLFLPWLKFEYEGYTYQKDRAYVFEKQLIENTDGLLEKPLSAYRVPEQQGITPMVLLTPYIVNDGRQLMISPHGVSYMTTAPIGHSNPGTVEMDAVDFGRFFKKQGAEDLRFASALRMSATYPYILPNVNMPTIPSIEVMDAGLRDNYGIGSATRFIQVFQDWIVENTSGVIMIQVTSLNKIDAIDQNDTKSLYTSIVNPLGVAGQILSLQDYELDKSIGFVYDLLGPENFEVVRFVYKPNKNNPRASVTFHLTNSEKEDILSAMNNKENQAALLQLKSALQN